jgi:hypothetical protein
MSANFARTVWLADRQHGRVAWWQLVAAGVDPDTIKRWVRDGRLRPVHHGVYAVGHRAPSLLGDLSAAVLACGAGAAVSHRSAAHLLGLVKARPRRIEVTVPTTAGRARPGIVVHRVRHLPALDTAKLHGISVTTPARTLLDLAPKLVAAELTKVAHEAWVRHGTTPETVEGCIARNPRKKAIAKLRRALGADVTLSELEDGFVALLARHDLPSARTNVDRHGDKVDCHWPGHGLTVELVSYRYHGTRQAFETDVARRRRSSHVAYSYGDVFERSAATAADVRRRLAA